MGNSYSSSFTSAASNVYNNISKSGVYDVFNANPGYGNGSSAMGLLEGISKMASDSANAAESLANDNTARTFQFNHDEAQLSRDWQTEMSNTAHQREVQDLRAAGLNPVLSVNNGAQSYTTSSASGQADTSGVAAMSNLAQSQISSAASLWEKLIDAETASFNRDYDYKIAKMQKEATEYAADKSYNSSVAMANASKYSADINYSMNMDKPASGLYALIDKYFGNSGFAQNTIDTLTSAVKGWFNGENSYTKKNGKLNNNGIKYINSQLTKLGVPVNKSNRSLYKQAFIDGNKSAAKKFQKLLRKYNK